jgi:hypothetical protein
MLAWNTRIVFHNDVYEVREVFYEDDAPTGHGAPFLSSDSVDDLRESYEKIQEAFGAPVLREEDFSPGHPVSEACFATLRNLAGD